MLVPVLEEHRSSRSPVEIFRAVYERHAVSFFLDSVEYRHPNQRYSYIGMAPFLEVIADRSRVELRGSETGTYPLGKLTEVLRGLFLKYRIDKKDGRHFFSGGAVGFFSYELAALFERIRFRKRREPEIPLVCLGFYRDLIIYDHKRKVYILLTLREKGRRHHSNGISEAKNRLNYLREFFRIRTNTDGFCSNGRFAFRRFRPGVSKRDFKRMVRRAKEYIRAGDIYQANLSQRFAFRFEGSPFRIYERLRKINPSPFSSFLSIGDLKIVSCSPERLISKRGRVCETDPIAGTRPRFIPNRKPQSVVRELLGSEKERAEHIMLVDLERNDLGRVCRWPTVRVKEMMKVEKYSHVIHIVSKITGRLRSGQDALDVIRAMFPGGTITGCPKVRCMEIIEELEPVGRGIYTGSIGYLGFDGDMDLNIVIRTLVLKGQKGYMQVGAGIVHDSDPDREYEETLHKGEALVEALKRASL